jgi:hypothetical protein
MTGLSSADAEQSYQQPKENLRQSALILDRDVAAAGGWKGS